MAKAIKDFIKLKRTYLKPYRLLFFILIAVFSSTALTAQNADSIKAARQHVLDSTKIARQQYNDSVATERKRVQDSTKLAQKRYSDSVKAERIRIADSIASVRSYLQSKRYNDSMDLIRQQRLDSIKMERQRVNDSINAERQRIADSTQLARQRYNDSLRTALEQQRLERERINDSIKIERQRIYDSIAAINAYRKSDHYKDSVASERQRIRDSLIQVRKNYTDSVRQAQQALTDSLNQARQRYNDSLQTVLAQQREERQRYADSMAIVRQVRSDSLAQARADREAQRKVREKEREKKKKLSLELKIQKQQEAYTNETMRRRKWNFGRKAIQNTFTRYNYYYNADRKMNEAEDNMRRAVLDNYDSLLTLFYFDPDKDSTKVITDMDTIIRKTSVGIQLHDPRGKWQDNLYLLTGKAYYYKGDYKNAAAAFKYIISEAEAERIAKAKKEQKGKKSAPVPLELGVEEKDGLAGLLEHKSSKNEAMLWLAQTFTQEQNYGQAQSLLDMLRNDTKFPETLQGGLALQQAFIDLRNKDFGNALKSLMVVANDPQTEKTLRQRSAFLSGQLLQAEKRFDESDKYFRKAIDMNPPFEMDFYARMQIVQNNLNANNSSGDAGSMLNQMAHDAKYRNYFDQIYYNLAVINLRSGATEAAKEQLRKSIDYSQNNRRQKGLSYVAMGELLFNSGDYSQAKSMYDTAATLLTTADQPEYDKTLRLSRTLDRIAAPASEVKKQDSLLALSALSEKEQRAAVRKYIREQEKMLRDSVLASKNIPIAQNAMSNSGAGEWYFANPSLLQQGSNSFKQKWGERELKDNWRRSSNFFAGSGSDDVVEEDADKLPEGLDEDSLMAAIPHTADQIAKANKKLEEALFQLGKAYYNDLEDYANAVVAYDRLDARYPNHEHQDEVLYHRFIIALHDNDSVKANGLRNTLQNKYPESVFTKALRSNNDNATTAAGDEAIMAHYDETYRLLMDKEYAQVIQRANETEELFPAQSGRFAKQYNLLKAVAIAGTGDYRTADTMLTEFLKVNPEDALSPWANDVLLFIKKQIPDSLSNNNPAVAPAPTPVDQANMQYLFNANSKQFVLISAATLDGKLMGVKSGITDYNITKRADDHIKTTITALQGGRGILILKEFSDIKAGKNYIAEIKGQKNIFREYGDNDIDMMLISPENLNVLYQKNDYDTYKQFYQKYYK